jgi:hypothetical protein
MSTVPDVAIAQLVSVLPESTDDACESSCYICKVSYASSDDQHLFSFKQQQFTVMYSTSVQNHLQL